MITALVLERGREYDLDLAEKQALIEGFFNRMRRLDVLQPLLEDPMVTDVLVNGPDAIYVERQGRLERTELRFASLPDLEALIHRISAGANRSISQARPFVDARMADGSRIAAVMSPTAIEGPFLAIRKFQKEKMDLEELIDLATMSQAMGDLIDRAVRARWNILISGGTGSGKTTLLNALLKRLPKEQRVVVVEDAAELQVQVRANQVSMEGRQANAEGQGEIRLRQLIRMALRLRPDRIVVGEVRGEEAFDMLQAMNTGHAGCMCTLHANSAVDALSRIEWMVMSAGYPLPVESIRQQAEAALDLLVHLGKDWKGKRKVLEIIQICREKEGLTRMRQLYVYDGADFCQREIPDWHRGRGFAEPGGMETAEASLS